MKINSHQRAFGAYLAAVIIFWIILQVSKQREGLPNYLYSFFFSLIPLVGGIIGMTKAKLWGGFKSYVGKAVFFISLGLFMWGAGSMGWSYYNLIAHIEAPYPSLADLGFAPSIFFYGLGAIYLSKATGAKFGFRSNSAKLFAFIAPVLLLIGSYYVLVTIGRGGVLLPEGETPLKAILDIAYPLGDFVSLAVSVVITGLSFRYLGGRMKSSIISILLGLTVMYVADFIFSYTTTAGTFYNGDFGDLVLTLGLFFLTFGVLGFTTLKESQSIINVPVQ